MVRVSVLAVLVGLMGQPALAQEADDYVPPESDATADAPADPEPAPVAEASDSGGGWDYDWSGSYLGVSAGLAVGEHDTIGVGSISATGDALTGTSLGLQLGQNYHLSRIVLGTEMDFSKTSIAGDFALPGSALACGNNGFGCSADIGWIGSLRGRAGISMGDFLPYVTAGAAVAGVETTYAGPGLNEAVDGLAAGWVLGAGLEYAVMKHLTVRGEALHYQLNDVTGDVLGAKVSTDPSVTVVRAGLNLKF